MNRVRSDVVAMVIGALLASTLVGSPATAVAHAQPHAGSDGIGDPYFPKYGNGGYRVGRYDIDVIYHPGSNRLQGATVVRAWAKQRLSRFNLDLLVRASKVRVNGHQARFRQTKHELIVKPRSPLRDGHRFRVQVVYAGKPNRFEWHGQQAFKVHGRAALAAGQPNAAAWWFPSSDHPSDKARYSIDLTYPSGHQAISNGRLASRTRHGRMTTWHWRMGQPMATYLAFVAFGDYAIRQGHTHSGRPYLYAVDKSLSRKATRASFRGLRTTARVTRFLASRWGRYPYHELGGVATKYFGTALETQTRPVYDATYFKGRDRANSGIVSHEMAHQWFGDAVAIYRWRNLWLNEGYATYANWLWSQHRGGLSVAQRFRGNYARPASSKYWRFVVADPGPSRLFHDPVYTRAAMMLHRLRIRIGSKTFFRLSRRWVHHNDGVGSEREYQRLAERVSGDELDRFFYRWLHARHKPRL